MVERSCLEIVSPLSANHTLLKSVIFLTKGWWTWHQVCPGWRASCWQHQYRDNSICWTEQEFQGNLPLSRLRKIKQTFNIIMSSAVQKMLELYLFFPFLSGPISRQNKLDWCWNISLIKYWLTNYWDPLTPCESSYHSPRPSHPHPHPPDFSLI